MCGRYVSPDEASIERAWHIGRHNNNPFPVAYNVAPTTQVPVLRIGHELQELELTLARWGLIPFFWKKPKPPNFTFNARLEEAAGKPMWRDPLRRSRCLVPTLGWYEWQQVERVDPSSGEIRMVKQPHFIHRADGAPACFAGLLSWWSAEKGGEGQLSCAIITRAAAGPAAEVHDRMPVVLRDDAHAAWLDRATVDPATVDTIIQSGALVDELEHYAVSTRVNNSRSEGADLIVPLI